MTTTTTTAALAEQAPIAIGVPMMDADEAREYLRMMQYDLESVDQSLTNFRARAVDFAEREGWRAHDDPAVVKRLIRQFEDEDAQRLLWAFVDVEMDT